jgi:hypothetical protein
LQGRLGPSRGLRGILIAAFRRTPDSLVLVNLAEAGFVTWRFIAPDGITDRYEVIVIMRRDAPPPPFAYFYRGLFIFGATLAHCSLIKNKTV